jgi:hypothetical protein
LIILNHVHIKTKRTKVTSFRVLKPRYSNILPTYSGMLTASCSNIIEGPTKGDFGTTHATTIETETTWWILYTIGSVTVCVEEVDDGVRGEEKGVDLLEQRANEAVGASRT